MTTDELLARLRASKTDLGRFVEAMVRDQLPQLLVSANAVQAWQEREPQTWVLVCDWLAEQGKSARLVNPCQEPKIARSIGVMDYIQRGVLDAQARVHERLHRILVEHGMVLDPGSPLWFDGRPELPQPGEPWTMKLSCRGATSTVEFTPAELDAFLIRPAEVVSQKLRRAVDALKPPNPQEPGLA